MKRFLWTCLLFRFCLATGFAQVHVHPKIEPSVQSKVTIELPKEEKFGWEVLTISPDIQHDQMAMPNVPMPERSLGDLKLPRLELEKLDIDSAIKSLLAGSQNPMAASLKNVDFSKQMEMVLAGYYDSIKTKAIESDFGTSVRAIYKDIPNGFVSLRGMKHISKGDSIHPELTWYEIQNAPKDAIRCSQYRSKLGAEVCNCNFYFGDIANEATAAFDSLFEKTQRALGDQYLCSRKPFLFPTEIPANAQSLAVFGKRQGSTRTRVPVIAAYLQKTDKGKFIVNLLFYETLF